MSNLREIHEQCKKNYLQVKNNWPKEQISSVAIIDFLKAIERLQNKILDFRKDFPLSSFGETSALIKCNTVNTKNYREMNKGRKIDILNEAAPSFTLETRGVFFSIDTYFGVNYGKELRVQPLEMYIESDKKFTGEIIGFMDNGKWVYVKSLFETVSPAIYQRNHEKSRFDTFFKKITLTVKEINFIEWISEISFSERYYKECKYVRCSDIKKMEEKLLTIFKVLRQYIEGKHARIVNKLGALETFLEEIVLDEVIMADALSNNK